MKTLADYVLHLKGAMPKELCAELIAIYDETQEIEHRDTVGYKFGEININELPVGDPTLSEKEIIGNESQERMGLVIKKQERKC